MAKEKKVKKPKGPRKESKNLILIKRLVEIPDPCPAFFWPKESKFAKKFLEIYGDDLLKLVLPEKLKSLAFLGYMKNLEERIKSSNLAANYVPAEYEKVEVTGKKVGKDAIIKRRLNLRQWLEEKPK